MCSLHDVFGGHDHVNGNYLPRPLLVVEVEQNNSQKGKKNRVALYVAFPQAILRIFRELLFNRILQKK